MQALKDKKLKGQLADREELYKKSANAAAKAEKVSLFRLSDIVFCQVAHFLCQSRKSTSLLCMLGSACFFHYGG